MRKETNDWEEILSKLFAVFIIILFSVISFAVTLFGIYLIVKVVLYAIGSGE